MIVDEVKKYSPNARKLKAKAGKLIDSLNVITIVQFKTDRKQEMHASRFNLRRGIHVTSGLKHKMFQAKHVKLSRDLLSLHQKLPSLREKLPCTQKAQKHKIENFPFVFFVPSCG